MIFSYNNQKIVLNFFKRIRIPQMNYANFVREMKSQEVKLMNIEEKNESINQREFL